MKRNILLFFILLLTQNLLASDFIPKDSTNSVKIKEIILLISYIVSITLIISINVYKSNKNGIIKPNEIVVIIPNGRLINVDFQKNNNKVIIYYEK